MNNYWVIKKVKKAPKIDDVYFSVDDYYFMKCDKISKGKNNKFEQIVFKFSLAIDDEVDIVSIFNYLLPLSKSGFKILGQVPFITTELIKKYDENKRLDDICLFHDIRTQYIIFGVPEGFEDENSGIVFIGVNIFNREIEFAIKAFNFDTIRDVHEIIIEEIKENVKVKSINYHENIKWLLIDKYKVLEKRINLDSLEKKILLDSINCNYEKMYRSLFLKLISKGYITPSERTEISKLKTANGAKIRSILKRCMKLSVEEGKATLMHDDASIDIQHDDKNTVYTLSSKGWRYFMNHWFEDYIGQVLKKIKNINIEYMKPEIEFNFNNPKEKSDNMEIDWLILATKDGVSKIIAIECKRTITSKIIDSIKEKYSNKFLKTTNHYLIDGFINVGYFLPCKGRNKYVDYNSIKVESVSVDIIEKPFLTFVSDNFQSFCDNFEKSIETIFTN